ncbi:unnamed protein product, partial [Phaeothamnion confervicola]
QVVEPYEGVRLRTLQSHNVQSASRLAKRVLRLLSVLRRLRSQAEGLDLAPVASPDGNLSGPPAGAGSGGGRPRARAVELRELASAALALQEAEAILADPLVRGVMVAERERRYVSGVAGGVRRAAAEALARGLANMAQAEVAGALQVFYNLQCLPERV